MSRNKLSPTELLDMAREVLNVCSDHALKDILDDLEITNSSEQTINRILDGQFLKKVEHSHPLPALAKDTKESKDVIMLLSSSDDESVKDASLTGVRTGKGTTTKLNNKNRGRSTLSFPMDPLPSLSPPNSPPRSSRNYAKESWQDDTTENQYDPWESNDYEPIINKSSPLSRKQPSPKRSETAVIELFPLSRTPITSSTRPFTQDNSVHDEAFSEWDYTLLRSPDRGCKSILFSSSVISSPFKPKARSPDLDLSDLEDVPSTSPRNGPYTHRSKRGSPIASDLLPRIPTHPKTDSSFRSSKNTEIILDDDDDEDVLDRNFRSWRPSLERSLSPPPVFNSDTDSETERLMDDVFSGNKKSRAKKAPLRSGSKVQKKAKSNGFSLEELDAWGDDSYGDPSMSIEEEIAHRAAQRRKRVSKTSDSDLDGPRKPDQKQKKRQKTNAQLQEDERKAEQKAERDAKRAQKDAEKAQRDAEKAVRALEAKKLRDLRLEEKDAEKKANRDLKIANRLTTKSDSVKEMVVCIEYSLQQSEVGKALQHYWTMLECGSVAIRALESDISIPPNTLGSVEGIPRETCPLRNMIFWRRRVFRRYNEEQDMFVLTGRLEIDLEPFTLIYLTGKEFALHIELGRLRSNLETVKRDMVTRRNKDNLRKHGSSQESSPENGKQRVIYLIEGMETFIRGLKTNTTKKFRQAVLAQMQPDLPSGTGSNNKNNMDDLEDPVVDRERIELELLWLQLEQDCLIIHTHDDVDSSQAVVSLTEQIGLAPYKNHQTKSDLNICVEGVKSGTDSEDIWMKTLQQIHMVTLPVAKAIATEYPNIRSLYEGYRRCSSVAEAQKMLADLEIMGRFIGKSLSRRVYDVFMSDDAERSVT